MKTWLSNNVTISILTIAGSIVVVVAMVALLTYLIYGIAFALTVLGILAGILYFATLVGIGIHKYINE